MNLPLTNGGRRTRTSTPAGVANEAPFPPPQLLPSFLPSFLPSSIDGRGRPLNLGAMMALRDAAAGPARVPRDNAFYSFCCAEFLTLAVSDGDGDGDGDGGQKALEEDVH